MFILQDLSLFYRRLALFLYDLPRNFHTTGLYISEAQLLSKLLKP